MDTLRIVIANGLPIIAGTLGFFRPLDASKIVGVVLSIAGSLGWVRPVHTGVLFGIPFSDPTNTLFIPGIGGRNLAAGITILTLSFLGQRRDGEGIGHRKALGLLLLAWTLAGYSDSWILWKTPGSNNLEGHVQNIVVLSVVSLRLLTQ